MKKYDSYKDSGIDWIGQIPSHWKICKVKNYSDIYSGEPCPAEDQSEDFDNPIYGGGDILGHSIKPNMPADTLILGRVGGDGKVRHVKTAFWATDNALIIDTKLNKTFLGNVLNCADLLQYNTSTAQPLLTATKIKNINIPVPPASEQKEIADYLDRKCGEIDAAVAKVEKELELLDELKQSEISKAVTKGLNPNVSFKPSGIDWIGEIPSHWKIMRFKHFADCRMGETILGEDLKDIGAIPVYSATLDDSVFGYVENAKLILKPNDFVIPARGNSIGNVSIIKNGIATCTQTTICARNIRDINIKYLFYCSRAYKESWFYYDATAIPQITVVQVNNNPVPFPPLSEQKEIADYLDRKCGEIDSLKEKLKQKKEKLQELRQSLISEVVTGKRCVLNS